MYGGGGDGFLDSSIVNSSRECKLAGRPSMFYSISIENTRIYLIWDRLYVIIVVIIVIAVIIIHRCRRNCFTAL